MSVYKAYEATDSLGHLSPRLLLAEARMLAGGLSGSSHAGDRIRGTLGDIDPLIQVPV